jgi:hypothetical protein
VWATNRRLAHRIYRQAKAFNQLPSSVAGLDSRVDELGRHLFDRGIWAFGEAVARRLDEVCEGTTNAAIARAQHEREWARLMGDDMTNSAVGFRDVNAETIGAGGRMVGDDPDSGDEDMPIAGDLW